jgi:septal ring factor EnvC (AmiA/AmiB activator)
VPKEEPVTIKSLQAVIAELNATIVTLKAESSEKDATIANLKESKDDLASKFGSLTADNVALRDEIESLKKEKSDSDADAEAVIAELSEKLADRERQGGKVLPVVPIGKEKYAFTIPVFRHEGQVIKAEDAAADKDLCAHLVSIGFGGLVKLSK